MGEVFIVGDSHALAIRDAFVASGWTVHGGMMASGREFDHSFFDQVDGRITFHNEEADTMFSAALASAGVSRMVDLDMPVVTTMGFNSNRLARQLYDSEGEDHLDAWTRWSGAVMDAVVSSTKASVLEFCRWLPTKRSYAVLSPQRMQPHLRDFVRRAEGIYAAKLAALGINIVDVRDKTVDENGILREEFCRQVGKDQTHANAAYGAIVMQRLADMLAAET